MPVIPAQAGTPPPCRHSRAGGNPVGRDSAHKTGRNAPVSPYSMRRALTAKAGTYPDRHSYAGGNSVGAVIAIRLAKTPELDGEMRVLGGAEFALERAMGMGYRQRRALRLECAPQDAARRIKRPCARY